MGGGKGSQTIGYHYLFSILFGIGRGPINELRMIKAADKVVWDGHSCRVGDVHIIDKPDLFGGEKKEGGIQGLFRLMQGAPDQVIPGASPLIAISGYGGVFANAFGQLFKGNPLGGVIGVVVGSLFGHGPNKAGVLPDLKALIGGRMGELRGRVTLFYDGLMSSMNPYIKEWTFRVRRTWAGWDDDDCWYKNRATIYLQGGTVHAMNPAHILYECCTNRSWGRGLNRAKMGSSWVYAANRFCEESLGLCLVWYRREDIDDFIQRVCDHAGCVVFTDRETGLIEIKVLRADYSLADLPHFDMNSGLLSIKEDDSGSSDASASEVIITGLDPLTNQKIEGRAHNLAVRHSRDGAASVAKKYEGLPTVELCNRVAARDLAVGAGGIRKFTVVLDRAGFKLHPGAVFAVSYAPRGIVNLVLRAGEIDDGNMLDGKIKIKAVQDVFSLPDTTWITPVENTWTPPSSAAVAATDERLFELGYRDIYLHTTKDTADSVGPGESYFGSVVGRPAVTNTQYRLLTRTAGDSGWPNNATFYFTANATLSTAIDALATTFVVDNVEDFEEASSDLVGDSLLIGEERMKIASFDPDTRTFEVVRGVCDTWPAAHAAGDRVWLPDDDYGTDGRLYAEGEIAEAKALPKSTSEELPEADATLMTLTLTGRAPRPYPPADVKVNSVSIYGTPDEGTNEPVVTWVERNRITQGDQLVGFFDPTVTPEAGTTYRIRFYMEQTDPTEYATYDGITSGWTYSNSDQTIDGVDTKSTVWAELVSVRDGIESWNPTRFRVVLRSGYGYAYGYNYGGA
jgi:hypothetical protein